MLNAEVHLHRTGTLVIGCKQRNAIGIGGGKESVTDKVPIAGWTRRAVACFVGISQGRARHLAAESHVVELAADGTKARFDVAKTLAVGQLSERHRQILIPTGQIFQIAITPVAGYALLELLVRKELDQLGEDGAPSVHPALSLAPQQIPSNPNAVSISNRFNANTHASH